MQMYADHLTLNLADKSDFGFYFAIKSESRSIYWSGFSMPPDKTRLLEHYMARLNSENRATYVLKECDVRLGYLCVDEDPLNSTFEISYGISAKYAGRGFAKAMIGMWMENIKPISATVVAWIAESNIASIKTATALGFRADDQFEYRQLAQCPAPVIFIRYVRSAFG